MTTSSLKRTPLHARHVSLKARMVPFGGWDMPVQYSGVIQEHEAVRTKVGLFDVSHMGEFLISGAGARAFLQSMTTNDLGKLYDGRCQYNLMCYPNGTAVDDLIISQIDDTHFIAVVNASNIDKDFAWLSEHNTGADCQLTNVSTELCLFALQGPNAEALLQDVLGSSFAALKYYHFQSAKFKTHDIRVFRTGYTGEDGFEVMIPNAFAVQLWDELMEKGQRYGLLPIGLGARDTLRLEASYSLYGHEINDQINALEAKLGWIVSFDKGDFIGRSALAEVKASSPKRLLYGFEMTEPGVARDGYGVSTSAGVKGFVTSGTHSPTLKKSIGLAMLENSKLEIGQELVIDVRGKPKTARIIKTPFYKRAK